MTPLLVLDCHYLCHRAFHAQGHLSWKGAMTGVVFGFLKDISRLKDEFQTDRIAFCFEAKKLERHRLFPNYKSKRTSFPTKEEQEAYVSLGAQIERLRENHLYEIGFRNVFHFPGMEADDIMASLAKAYEDVILVTADSDLYQCLRPGVSLYHPQKQVLLDDRWFQKIYGIPPTKWAQVKAIAGCHSDKVPGVGGVGEATALKFLKGELKEESAAWRKIMGPVGKEIIRRNRKLVELPFTGCPTPKIQKDEITRNGWRKVCSQLGMRSLAGQPPVLTRKLGLLDA